MDDSDDYFDDLVLDERALAALDQVETQFVATQPAIPANSHVSSSTPRNVPRPPAKRQKTESLVPHKRQLSTSDYDDLPEISVQGDNYFQVNSASTAPRNGVVYRPSDTQAAAARSTLTRSSSSASIGRNAPPPRSSQQRRTGGSGTDAQPVSHPTRGLQRLPSSQHAFGMHDAPPGTQGGDSGQKARRDAEILRAKLEEFEKNQLELERRLQHAEDARLAKEGEVSILRKTIAKTSEQHAAEVGKLQAAREAAEAAKIQLQKEQRDELERLKTHYTFRQHEIETSTRKAPWSVTKKHARLGFNTPVKMHSSQMRGWNPGGGLDVGFAETPRGARFGGIERPLSQKPRHLTTAAETNKKKVSLPGFYNAFADSPAPNLSQKKLDKGKGRQHANLIDENPFVAEHPRFSPPSSPLAAHFNMSTDDAMDLASNVGPSNLSGVPTNSPLPVAASQMVGDGDVKMFENSEENERQEDEEIFDVDPDWREQLHHVTFTHTLPPGNVPTLQTLFNSSLLPTATPEQHSSYSAACSRLLQILGATPLPILWEDHLRDISSVFSDLARILNETATIYPLSSLLSLMRTLLYVIPTFTAALLSCPSHDVPPPILSIYCDMVCMHIDSPNTKPSRDEYDILAKEGLLFLECLALTAPEEQVPLLSTVIRSPKVLSILSEPSQPTWLIAHATRALGIMASNTTLSRHLTSLPSVIEGPESSIRDSGRLLHLEQLSFYLVDSTRTGPEADQLRDNILMFFSILAVSDLDALQVLLQSLTLIPSIIVHLFNETDSFWEDDFNLFSSRPKLDRVLQIISRTIALLYYMVFAMDEYDLNHRLHYNPLRQFHGVGHIYTVTMSRLAFAQLPSWLNDQDRKGLQQTVELAAELFCHAVQFDEWEEIRKTFKSSDDDQGCSLHADTE